MVESGFLLRSCTVKSCTVGSNPTLSEFLGFRRFKASVDWLLPGRLLLSV